MKNPSTRNSENATRVKRVAEICGVSKRYVRLVLNGDRQNGYVLSTYIQLEEGENLLLKAVKELVPLN